MKKIKSVVNKMRTFVPEKIKAILGATLVALWIANICFGNEVTTNWLTFATMLSLLFLVSKKFVWFGSEEEPN